MSRRPQVRLQVLGHEDIERSQGLMVVRALASVKQRGGNIKLVNPSKFAVQTLKLVGVLNLFEVFDDDDKAVESFR